MRRRDGNKPRRIERQEQAKARQATYDALSTEAKLVLASGRGTRQWNRLSDRYEAELEAKGKVGAVRLA